MTVVIGIGIAVVAGIAVLALGRRSTVGGTVGLASLLALTALAIGIAAGDTLTIGGATIAGSLYLRLFLAIAAGSAALLVVIGMAVGGPSSLAGVILLALAGAAAALATSDPVVGVLASSAGSVAAAVAVADRRSAPRITVAARALRATVVSGLLAAGGIVWLAAGARGLAVPGLDPLDEAGLALGGGVVGLAYALVAIGFAIRAGAIPFHGWAARIAEATPPAGIPAALALGPAGFAVVVVAWLDGTVGTLAEPLPVERGIVALLATVSIVLGAVAAWLHDDIEHVVAYSLVQDAGVILLAVAALDPAAWEPVRLWILAVIAVKSALAGWAAATRHAFGTRRVPDLGGWARRSPVLAAAFTIILVSAVGLPGLAAFEARSDLIALVTGGPLGFVLLAGALAPLVYLGRILVVGFGPPSTFVRAAAGPLPVRPRRAATSDRPERSRDRRRVPGGDAFAALLLLPEAWRVNRSPVAAALVLVLAIVGITVSAGGFGAVQAAAEPALGGSPLESFLPGGPGEPGPGESPAPTPSDAPATSGDPAPSVDPSTSEPTPRGTSPGGTSPSEEPSVSPGANPPPSFEPVSTP